MGPGAHRLPRGEGAPPLITSRTSPQIRAGRGVRPVELPEGWETTFVRQRSERPLVDPLDRLIQALEAPLERPDLRTWAQGKERVAIAVCDGTRPSPDPLVLPPMLDALAAGGVTPHRVTLLVGSGLHRAMTPVEKDARFGPVLSRGVNLVDHAAGDAAALADLGTIDGIEVLVHRVLTESDGVLATGIVEPHQFAGFSGGYKSVSIGAAGAPTIDGCHSPRFLRREGIGLGRLEGNPFQALMREIGERVGLDFVVNSVLDGEGRVVRIAAGAPDDVQRSLVEASREGMFEEVAGPFDAAIAGAPAPKDVNLYQASRVATYLQATDVPLLREGGTLIVVARCPEGAGGGTGERRFLEALTRMTDPGELVARAEAGTLEGGSQRAYFLARVLSMVKVVFVESSCPRIVRQIGCHATRDLGEALRVVAGHTGTVPRVLVVEDPFRTLPRGTPCPSGEGPGGRDA